MPIKKKGTVLLYSTICEAGSRPDFPKLAPELVWYGACYVIIRIIRVITLPSVSLRTYSLPQSDSRLPLADLGLPLADLGVATPLKYLEPAFFPHLKVAGGALIDTRLRRDFDRTTYYGSWTPGLLKPLLL